MYDRSIEIVIFGYDSVILVNNASDFYAKVKNMSEGSNKFSLNMDTRKTKLLFVQKYRFLCIYTEQ